MAAFEGNYLEGNPVAQMQWRQRQIRIARAVLCGAKVAAVAAKEGVTVERIRQILQMTCIHAFRLPKKKVVAPVENPFGMASVREHSEFWLKRLVVLERTWKLPPQGKSSST